MRASAHFLDRWVDSAIHPALVRLALSNIHDSVIVDADRSYFRSSREKRFCMMLEEFTDASESRITAFRAALQPARPTLGGTPYLLSPEPFYADCILFGSFKWLNFCCSLVLFAENDPLYD